MKYHHVCIQCGNTVPEEQTNVVITDIMKNDYRNKQVYCHECFKGLNKDIIAKNKNKNRHNSKNNNNNNNNNKTQAAGCCSGH